jgi:zinc transporter ZupT
MFYVVVEELIPSPVLGNIPTPGAMAVMAGFLLMMILDAGLA